MWQEIRRQRKLAREIEEQRQGVFWAVATLILVAVSGGFFLQIVNPWSWEMGASALFLLAASITLVAGNRKIRARLRRLMTAPDRASDQTLGKATTLFVVSSVVLLGMAVSNIMRGNLRTTPLIILGALGFACLLGAAITAALPVLRDPRFR